jgi:hypothetical protein
MKAGITCIAVMVAGSMAVFAQITERPGTAPTSQTPAAETQQQTAAATAPAEGSVAIVGCVQREADYRRTRNGGRGGAAGTGAGVGNEFVLVRPSTATLPDPQTPGALPTASATLQTAGMAAGAYELTGPAEGQLEQYVGRRVEIVGRMKSGPTAMSDRAPDIKVTVPESTTGRPDVSSTAVASPSGRPARPAGGVDITGHDLHLRKFEVASVREATGSCTPEQK